MKKIFAFCAMALVAGALFTSCKEKIADNTMNVKLGDEEWNAKEVCANQLTEQTLVMGGFETAYTDVNCAFVWGTMGTATGTYEGNEYVFTYQNGMSDTAANGASNWDITSHNQEINAIDLAEHTVDATVNQVMKNNAQNKDNVDLTITMKNVEWTVNSNMAKTR